MTAVVFSWTVVLSSLLLDLNFDLMSPGSGASIERPHILNGMTRAHEGLGEYLCPCLWDVDEKVDDLVSVVPDLMAGIS